MEFLRVHPNRVHGTGLLLFPGGFVYPHTTQGVPVSGFATADGP